MERNNVNLWLDDLRNPYLNLEGRVPESFLQEDLVWVRSFEELEKFIELYGIPKAISFDHDLGDTHYTPEKYWNDYNVSKLYQDIQIHTEKTGLDCVKYIINIFLDNHIEEYPLMYFHSANPVGNNNMKVLWNNFLTFKDKL